MLNKNNYGAEIGKRITCQVCNKQIFLRQTGYNNIDAAVQDRHSLLDQFEPIPNGWVVKHDLGGWTCPSCIEHYTRMLKNFKSGLQGDYENSEAFTKSFQQTIKPFEELNRGTDNG